MDNENKAVFTAGPSKELFNHCDIPRTHDHRDEYLLIRERDEMVQEFANGYELG